MPEFSVRRVPPTPSPVFDIYWRFAVERQNIWVRRLRSQPPPWTNDAHLLAFKFTNPYRASDRTSQHLIKEVLYQGSDDPTEVFFRTILFKLFNKIETWIYLQDRFDLVTETFDVEAFGKALDRLMESGRTVYSAAYIMPPLKAGDGRRKHYGHLALLQDMLKDGVAQKLQGCRRMQDAFELLLLYPGIGKFLAYQYVTDLNYSSFLDYSECEFVCAGPGAARGISKCFESLGEYSLADAIRWTCERQELEVEERGLLFPNLCGRPLQYIDCQNLFCEVDKYARVAAPEFNAKGQPTRVKQNFSAHGTLPSPWFPPKWGVNERLAELLHP